jgi:hypothetical protein
MILSRDVGLEVLAFLVLGIGADDDAEILGLDAAHQLLQP